MRAKIFLNLTIGDKTGYFQNVMYGGWGGDDGLWIWRHKKYDGLELW